MSAKLLSRSDANARVTVLEQENDVMFLALNDVVNLGAKWFGNSHTYSIGITRPKSACGGICIVRGAGPVAAYYFERYAVDALAHIAACITGADNEANRELLRRRSAIEAAKAYVAEQQKAA